MFSKELDKKTKGYKSKINKAIVRCMEMVPFPVHYSFNMQAVFHPTSCLKDPILMIPKGYQVLGEKGPEATSVVICSQLKSFFGVLCELI